MQHTLTLARIAPARPVTNAVGETGPALNVAVVYEDALTRLWATDLWDRVGQLIGSGGVGYKSWRASDLANPGVFPDAVELAAKADVLVISLRDTGELPLNLKAWIDAWLPRRAGRAGALVALLGVPAQPNAQSGRAHRFLERVARKAGLDFLPRERKLPEESPARGNPAGLKPAVNRAMALPGGAFVTGSGMRL